MFVVVMCKSMRCVLAVYFSTRKGPISITSEEDIFWALRLDHFVITRSEKEWWKTSGRFSDHRMTQIRLNLWMSFSKRSSCLFSLFALCTPR